jgi:biotin transport system substrate-specific component
MTTTTLAARRGARTTALGIVGFAGALALASQVAIPIPGTPVPITLQPMIVALAGLWLGPVAGATSMILYFAAGIAGAPVWSPFGLPGAARLLGPTGGYILAYPVAAFVAGWLARRATSFTGRAVAAVASSVVLLVGGMTQLAILHGSVGAALALGLTPFVPLDAVKAVAAAALAPRRAGTAPRR